MIIQKYILSTPYLQAGDYNIELAVMFFGDKVATTMKEFTVKNNLKIVEYSLVAGFIAMVMGLIIFTKSTLGK